MCARTEGRRNAYLEFYIWRAFFLACVTIRLFPFLLRTNVRWLEFCYLKLPYDLIFVLSPYSWVRFQHWSFFLIILPFHSLLATIQVSCHCFGWNRSKVVQGSKLMNTFMNGPRFFWFHFFNFFHQFNHFYYFRPLHAVQDVKNHCVHLRGIESTRAWKHEITKLKKKIFASNPEKNGHKKKYKKTWMKWNHIK